MCDIYKIVRTEHSFSDLWSNKNASYYDYIVYNSFLLYLERKCKCSNEKKFRIKDWI